MGAFLDMDKIHTSKDTVCDMDNIEAIIAGLSSFINEGE